MLITDLSKNNFQYLSQEFHNNVLGLVKQKGFYSYEYMSDFKNFKEELPSKEKLFSSLTDRKINGKVCEHVLNVWNKSEMKILEDYYDLYLKSDVLLSADVFRKFRSNSLKNYVQVII